MRVHQLMTRDVATVTPQTSLKAVAVLLAARRISGVPVCDEGRVVGVVTEADILWKELGLGGGKLIERFLDNAYGRTQRIEATTAGEAMTSPAITVRSDASVTTAAELMIDNKVNRLPVVDGTKLVGIVARADLVRAFTRTDREIESEINQDVLLRTLWVDPASVTLAVMGGKVTIGGEVDNRSTAELIDRYIRRVPGVIGVRSSLTWQFDDRAHRNRLPSRVS